MIKDCPNIKKKNEKTMFKSKKAGKRDMVATWSDNNSSMFGENLCLMARENFGESDESEEVCLKAKSNLWCLEWIIFKKYD